MTIASGKTAGTTHYNSNITKNQAISKQITSFCVFVVSDVAIWHWL